MGKKRSKMSFEGIINSKLADFLLQSEVAGTDRILKANTMLWILERASLSINLGFKSPHYIFVKYGQF